MATVVKLMGGMGNQLFQFAFGQVQEKAGLTVYYDRSWFDNTPKSNTKRLYRLGVFNITVLLHPFLEQPTISESKFQPGVFLQDDHNYSGYWQYMDYYDDIRKDLDLTVRKPFYTEEYLRLKNIITNEKTTAIHIRRTDYLTTPGFSVLSLVYYMKALSQTEGTVIVFSDDLKWCRENLKLDNRQFIFVDEVDYLSFDLMQRCTNIIIANSSFSMWAAYMSQAEIIIAPKNLGITTRAEEKVKHFPKNWRLI